MLTYASIYLFLSILVERGMASEPNVDKRAFRGAARQKSSPQTKVKATPSATSGTWAVSGPCSVAPDDEACVTSPGYPSVYGPGEVCNMTLLTSDPKYLQVQDFTTELGNDFLYVAEQPFSGAGESVRLMEGLPLSGTLAWASDESVEMGGWKICARESPPTPGTWIVFGPCSAAPDDSSCITSGNYPGKYGYGEVCDMFIYGNVSRYVEVKTFETEAAFDQLVLNGEAYSGSKENGKKMEGQLIEGSVKWFSDIAANAPGWKICAREKPPTTTTATTTSITHGSWVIEGPCLVDSNDTSCVTSPSFPLNYGDDETCNMWVFGIDDWYLEIDRFQTEFGYDWLTVNGEKYSGEASKLRRHTHGIPITSHIEWETDSSGTMEGWRICSRLTPPTTTTHTSTSGVLGSWVIWGPCKLAEEDDACVTSPNFPDHYGPDEECTMDIYGGVEKYLEVLSFDTEEGVDTLTIGGRDFSGKASVAQEMWGSMINSTISWSSDESQEASGWKLCARTVAPTSTTTTTTYAPAHSWRDLGPLPLHPILS